MKKLFALAATTVLFSLSAQSQAFQNSEEGRLLDDYDLVSRGKITRKVPAKTMGSPYLNKTFFPAKVGNITKVAFMRYDAYNDEFEFINAKNDTLVLNKDEKFSTITFTHNNAKYQLVDYTNKKGDATNGYLVSLHENNGITLFKKQTVTFAKEQVAERPFEPSSPAKFEPAKDVFYFKNNDKGIVVFPSNKKGLLKLFPEKKAALEAFIKQNDIDFDKESDLFKLIDFLSTQNE